jgi:hypothetical protein
VQRRTEEGEGSGDSIARGHLADPNVVEVAHGQAFTRMLQLSFGENHCLSLVLSIFGSNPPKRRICLPGTAVTVTRTQYNMRRRFENLPEAEQASA